MTVLERWRQFLFPHFSFGSLPSYPLYFHLNKWQKQREQIKGPKNVMVMGKGKNANYPLCDFIYLACRFTKIILEYKTATETTSL